jgi:ribonuclease T2
MKKLLALLLLAGFLNAEGLFSLDSFLNKFKSDTSKSDLDSVLVLSWHNSFCETHSNKKECKLDGGEGKNHLVLHGLWPQPRNNVYCGVDEKIIELDKKKLWAALPDLHLKPEVLELMETYMPGYQSNLHKHEYYKHGTCYSKDPNEYFLDALTLTKYVDGILGEYLRANVGKKIKTVVFKNFAAKAIDKKIKNKLAVKCKRVVLNEVWISLKGKGRDLKKLIENAKPIRSNCVEFIVDAPGKFRRHRSY